jgi:hypothetical protein
MNEKEEVEGGPRRVAVNKEAVYIMSASWQPSVEQTRRGMSALLSSLFQFSHAVGQKGSVTELIVLSVVYTVFRFPPAVRASEFCFFKKYSGL